MTIVDKASGKRLIGLATYKPMSLDKALGEVGAMVYKEGKTKKVWFQNEIYNYKDLRLER